MMLTTHFPARFQMKHVARALFLFALLQTSRDVPLIDNDVSSKNGTNDDEKLIEVGWMSTNLVADLRRAHKNASRRHA